MPNQPIPMPDTAATSALNRLSSLAPLLMSVSLVMSGCASTGRQSTDPSEQLPARDVLYTVQPGDRLGDIALEFTGDVGRWEDIAAANGIDDPRGLHVGTVIEIPAALIPAIDAPIGEGDNDTSTGSGTPNGARQATSVGAQVDPERAEPKPVLTPVDVNRRFELSPLDEPQGRTSSGQRQTRDIARNTKNTAVRVTRIEPVSETVTATDGRPRVRVLGSYFPKGIYAQPASYSRLMMRVAPGTLFTLERRVGDWYGIVTDQGIGYLRDIDGKVLGSGDSARLVSAEDARV